MSRFPALVLAAVAAILPSAATAQPADRTVVVRFAPGGTGARYDGTVRGYQSVNYIVNARAGQLLVVRFQSPRACFNVWSPGADEADFIGSQSATGGYNAPITVSGNQRVQVYLMRNEARRGRPAPYTINISVR